MISLVKFKKIKEILEENIQKKSFRSRFLFETLQDEKFGDEILEYIEILKSDVTAIQLDNVLTEIRNKTIAEYEIAKTAEDNNEKLNRCMRSLAYFYLLECMDEYSTISDNVIKSMQEKYKDKYLEIMAKADKIYLSIDMKEKLHSSQNVLDVNDDLIQKYLVLKKWQDDQHYFFEGDYWNDIEKIHQNYVGENNLNPFELEQSALLKRLFDKIVEDKVVDLETCSLLSELYVKESVVNLIGGKMYGLAVLNSKGIPVPYTVVIPTFAKINEDDLKFLNDKFEAYSVRSSADIEDGIKNSFAGMFDSFLDVKPEVLLQNINMVKNSVENERVKEYIKLNNLAQPHMSVIIQSFKEPSYAGVWIGNSDNSGVLEYVEGNGEKLVSGQSTPCTEIWNAEDIPENPLKINGISVGDKMLEYQRLTGCNSDFEWMILDEELVMLQFRPVTRSVTMNKVQNKENKNIYGIPAAPGKICGQPRFLNTPNETLKEGEILLTKITGTSWVPNLMRAKGAVTARGGVLCHTAIICRELGIPCVTGVGDEALKKLSQAKNISIDGNTGEIIIEKTINKCNEKDDADER